VTERLGLRHWGIRAAFFGVALTLLSGHGFDVIRMVLLGVSYLVVVLLADEIEVRWNRTRRRRSAFASGSHGAASSSVESRALPEEHR
jgi:hypothetical protein